MGEIINLLCRCEPLFVSGEAISSQQETILSEKAATCNHQIKGEQ
jgi:hypothetical protein